MSQELLGNSMKMGSKISNKLPHCRFCGENKKIEHLLDFSCDQNILQDLIMKFEFMKIEFFDFECVFLPKTVCELCWKLSQDCYDFIYKMKQTQINLINFYTNSNDTLLDIKIEDIDPSSDPDISLDNFNFEKNNKFEEETGNQKEDLFPLKLKSQKLSTLDLKRKIIQTSSRKMLKRNKFKTLAKEITEINSNIFYTKNEGKLTDNKKSILKIEQSWTDYDWSCMHCQIKFSSMTELRDHSKMVHAICFAYQCFDCSEFFNYFNLFIEHVRWHRENLRLYCQFCNSKFSSPSDTITHSATHWSISHICTLCGEMLPTATALDRHKKAFKKVALPQRCYKKKPKKVAGHISWEEYEWRCQDCSLPASSASLLRAHTRAVHGKCFAMKCADCFTAMTNFKQFVEHVSSHRESLKNYCPYCNIPINEDSDHISSHISGPQKPCTGCGEVFPDSASLTQHKTLYDAPRVRGSKEKESVTCGLCNKKFNNNFQLRNHKVIHNDKRDRDQVCHTCGKAFYDSKTLTNHIRTHFNKTETCEICKKTFLTKQRLKVHLLTHLEMKQFVCNECGKTFRRKSQLRLHLASHSNDLPFQCPTCNKCFRLQSYLKIHERQHTGIRPFSCEICNETFNHWGNCNRHMIRKHGVTFAKTKITAQGKLDINRKTGEAMKIEIGGSIKQWCDEMLKPKKRGRKKKDK